MFDFSYLSSLNLLHAFFDFLASSHLICCMPSLTFFGAGIYGDSDHICALYAGETRSQVSLIALGSKANQWLR
jgi:hypothetical protein